jgi:hypothetical protein
MISLAEGFTVEHDIHRTPRFDEWYCVRCGRVSREISCDDATADLERYKCDVVHDEQAPSTSFAGPSRVQ